MIDFAKTINDAIQGKTYLFCAGQAGFIIKNITNDAQNSDTM